MISVTTFSIVAHDPVTGEWGVGVQSKFLAVGAVVPWAQSGAGAIATQSLCNVNYGRDGLALLSQGKDAQEVVETLVGNDPGRDDRQIGVVDGNGGSFAYTGIRCHSHASHVYGKNYSCQGNLLVEGTVEAMAESFERGQGKHGALAYDLLAALLAGERAGGDRRGRESAALLVVKEKGGYCEFNDRYIDLRIDDHPDPLNELQRLVKLHHLYFQKTKKEDLIPIAPVEETLIRILLKAKAIQDTESHRFDAEMRSRLTTLMFMENLEDRWDEQSSYIDSLALEHLSERYLK